MKKIILLIFILSVLVGCAEYVPTTLDVPDFKDYKEAWEWIQDNIDYYDEVWEHWQYPEETLEKGYGDCEDFAILMIEICKQQFDCNPYLVKAIKKKGCYGHVYTRIGGYTFDGNQDQFLTLQEIKYEDLYWYVSVNRFGE